MQSVVKGTPGPYVTKIFKRSKQKISKKYTYRKIIYITAMHESI